MARSGRWLRAMLGMTFLAAMLAPAPVRADGVTRRVIVLIGGDAPHNPNVHEASRGVERLASALATSPDLRARIAVRSYPRGWPADPVALADAATVVLYFDGLDRHPLLDPARRAALAAAMARGVGLVALHQAATLPPDDRTVPLADWLGAVRHGMIDRTVEDAALVPARHPIASGVGRFRYRDEFYPTLVYRPGVVPVMRARLHREADPAAPATLRTVAWAYDRPDGGRAFGFTGFHYLDGLDRADLRKLLLNGIAWSAGLKVPPRGVRSTSRWLAPISRGVAK